MAGSLFNIALNFSQQEPIWIEILKYFIMPLVSVFIGAILAYKYSLNLEIIKKRDEQIEKFIIIYNKANILFEELIGYKRFLIEIIKPMYEYNPKKAACEPIYIPKIAFSEPLDEYVMLAYYNRLFPWVISNVNKNVEILLSLLKIQKKHREKCYSILKDISELPIEHIEGFKKDFNDLIDDIDKALYWVYILNDKLCKCNARYFSYLQKNVSDTFIIANINKKYMPKLSDKKYRIEKRYFKIFENHWLRPNNIWQDLELLSCKIANWFRFIFYYLTLNKIFKPKGKK